MTTQNKDFKVKHGLEVVNGGTFGGAVTVGTPTNVTHATTKQYVDNLVSNVGGGSSTVGSSEPISPLSGDFWFDTSINRLKMYIVNFWVVFPGFDDIGGFSGGSAGTTSWNLVLDGGSA